MDALSCEAVERAKAIIMGSMYRSVERMNRHITNGNLGSAASEQRLQIDLRSPSIFSADILGLPEDRHHSLSALTMLILARKIMGLGVRQLLEYHTLIKQKQGRLLAGTYDIARESPIAEEELMEVLEWTR